MIRAVHIWSVDAGEDETVRAMLEQRHSLLQHDGSVVGWILLLQREAATLQVSASAAAMFVHAVPILPRSNHAITQNLPKRLLRQPP